MRKWGDIVLACAGVVMLGVGIWECPAWAIHMSVGVMWIGFAIYNIGRPK